MPRRSLLFCSLILTLFLAGCVINMSPPASATPPAQPGAVLPAQTNVPNSTSQNSLFSSTLPTTTIPITWSDLNISGKLVYITAFERNNTPLMEIQALDLGSGVITTIFQAPQLGWIYTASVSPDEKQVVLGYSPPTGNQILYIMPLDGSSAPQPLFAPPTQDDQYLEPVWSPDGKYIYFVHANYALPPEDPNQHYPIFEIYRMAYPDGPLEKIVDKAYWPRLSADSSRLVYTSANPDDGTNKLFIANADGSNAQEVVLSGPLIPTIIDAPVLMPDGQTILFSAPVPAQSSAPFWLDRLFGAIVAAAHIIPSEWWSVPAGGGVPTQLTHIQAPGLYASISPDNMHIASFSGNGVFVMNPDGTGLTNLIKDVGGIPGTVNWIP